MGIFCPLTSFRFWGLFLSFSSTVISNFYIVNFDFFSSVVKRLEKQGLASLQKELLKAASPWNFSKKSYRSKLKGQDNLIVFLLAWFYFTMQIKHVQIGISLFSLEFIVIRITPMATDEHQKKTKKPRKTQQNS